MIDRIVIHKILTVLDKNNRQEANAVLVQLLYWYQAFDRQFPLLGIQSFIKIEKLIMPILVSYFQNRRLRVKRRSGDLKDAAWD